MASTFTKLGDQFIVHAGREQEFRDKVLAKYGPAAEITEGRRTMSRADELLFTYFRVSPPFVPEDEVEV